MAGNDTTTEQGRDNALAEIVPILSTVQKRSTLDRYVQKFARLHAMYNFNIARALESILADVQAYKNSTKNGTSGRSRGCALGLTSGGTRLPTSFNPDRQGFDALGFDRECADPVEKRVRIDKSLAQEGSGELEVLVPTCRQLGGYEVMAFEA